MRLDPNYARAYARLASFYVVLVSYTGADIEIEHRHADELGDLPTGARVWNPAFDVTPRELISGYLTDRGFVKPPFSGVTGV